MNIKIVFPDKQQKELESGVSVADAIVAWRKDALTSAVAAKVDGVPVDLSFVLTRDAAVEVIDISSKEGLHILRHSIAHVMAHAVQDVFRGAKVTIGPSIEDGFYYDFDYSEPFTVDDFAKIEKRMKQITVANYPFVRDVLPRAGAVDLFAARGEDYKVELINDLPSDVTEVSLYKDGDYIDLCRGPHVSSTGKIKAFKLLSVAG
ncbi:MAG: TGS domain-containing protein, partial [Smithellaceae bacterium]